MLSGFREATVPGPSYLQMSVVCTELLDDPASDGEYRFVPALNDQIAARQGAS